MTKRGKVLRDTSSGTGLLMVEGQQYRFRQEDWKSETPPGLGLVVDVELDDHGKVRAITAVPEPQVHWEQVEGVRRRNPDTISLRLVAVAFLAAAWLFLTAISIQVPFPGKLEFSFWQTLSLIHAGSLSAALAGPGSGAGLYGWVAGVVLAGPFLPRLWKNKRASIGGVLPLAFIIAVSIAAGSTLQNASGGVGAGSFGDAWKTLSLGPGAYASIFIGLFFAFLSARDLAAIGARAKDELNSPQRKAA